MRAQLRSSFLAVTALAAACSDPAPPDPEVASIELSVADTGTSIRFRDPLIVRAVPQAALGVPLERVVTWTPLTPALLSVQPLTANGDSARIRATGVGIGQVQVSAGSVTRTFQVTVKDTVYSVALTPGPLSLVAGDTVSYEAFVTGPPNADGGVRWDVTNATLLQTSTSPRPFVRILVAAAGTASVRATALADTTKTEVTQISVQPGRLEFLVQPSTTAREFPISPAVRVVVKDVAGNVSLRATNDVTLAAAAGSCVTSLKGAVTAVASHGVAEFPSVGVTRRCPAVNLVATARPPASPATSQAFSVTARGCDALVPIGLADTVSAVVENVDCVVAGSTGNVFAHHYVVTMTSTQPGGRLSVTTSSAAFAPRLESYVWPQYSSVHSVDSVSAPGTLTTWYVLAPGTYRLSLTTQAPLGDGTYSIRTGTFAGGSFQNGQGPCRISISAGLEFNGSPGPCQFNFASRSGQSQGRAYVLYVAPGAAITATMRALSVGSDTYLEVFDVTNPNIAPVLVTHDDNSGGGAELRDAMVRIDPAPTGRFLEIRALFLGASSFPNFSLTISP